MKLQESDDVVVALADLAAGESVEWGGRSYMLPQDVPAKHKFAARNLASGQRVQMYGVTVGVATTDLASGDLINTENIDHAVDEPVIQRHGRPWQPPDVNRWADGTFDGYVRRDGRVGTANHWIVVPLVFCENRNVLAIRDALLDELGYGPEGKYRGITRQMIEAWRSGRSAEELLTMDLAEPGAESRRKRPLPHVDGIKFLVHGSGCGETQEDTVALCRLLAGYVFHPNVAGATVLSLGCQKAQVALLEEEIQRLDPDLNKPFYVFDQQTLDSEAALVEKALRHTVAGLIEADRDRRQPAPLSKLILGTECGGSDGFSGLSANPAIGHCADLLVALGGSVILSEFPELSSVQQDLVERCQRRELAERFVHLMRVYHERLAAAGSGFQSNPSPGNIADGLITDAMKAAGAAWKGGTSPVVGVLDYPEPVRRSGLNLLCTPGGDVESTTAMAGSGANVMVFSTGLGTPTGNAIVPVLKMSTNSDLAQRMPDIIDLDAGPIVRGEATVERIGERLLDLVIDTASGRYDSKAVRLGQDDFLPWKRNLSL
jgi:altronate hydrolase